MHKRGSTPSNFRPRGVFLGAPSMAKAFKEIGSLFQHPRPLLSHAWAPSSPPHGLSSTNNMCFLCVLQCLFRKRHQRGLGLPMRHCVSILKEDFGSLLPSSCETSRSRRWICRDLTSSWTDWSRILLSFDRGRKTIQRGPSKVL